MTLIMAGNAPFIPPGLAASGQGKPAPDVSASNVAVMANAARPPRFQPRDRPEVARRHLRLPFVSRQSQHQSGWRQPGYMQPKYGETFKSGFGDEK